jgi:hypothetical protein
MRRIGHLLSVVFFAVLFFGFNAVPASAQSCGQNCSQDLLGVWSCASAAGGGTCQLAKDKSWCDNYDCAEAAKLRKLNVIPTGPWRSEWAQLCAVKYSNPSSKSPTALPKGSAIFGEVHSQIYGQDAALAYISFGTKTVFKQARLLNLSHKSIVGYRLAWVYTFPTERSEIVLGDWMDVSAGISSGTFFLVPERAGQQASNEPMITRGANSLMFFVAAVKYADGTIWRENTTAIKSEVDRTKPILQAPRTPASAATKSSLE